MPRSFLRPGQRSVGRVLRVALLLSAAGPASSCGGQAEGPRALRPTLTVFAAASLIDVLPEVGRAWQAEAGVAVRYSFGPTSKLVPQVIEGAPADVLISADVAWIERLEAEGKSKRASRVVVARNALVFVVPADATKVPASVGELPGPLTRIALAGEHVPAGRYAKAALLYGGVWERVRPFVKTGEDVRITLRWVAGGDADGGVVYATDAKAERRVRAAFEFPREAHPPVVYPAAPIQGSAHVEHALRFLDFCTSPQGQRIFERHGFVPVTP